MIVALDTETELIRPGVLAPRMVCLSLATECGEVLLFHHSEAETVIRDLLESDVFLVGHNVAYDFGVIAAAYPDLLPLIFRAYADDRITDTQIREYLQHLGVGIYRGYETVDGSRKKLKYGLADLALRRLGIVLAKADTWRLRYGELRDTPLDQWPDSAREYSLSDASTTLAVWQDQESERADLLVDQFRQARAAWWLHLTSCWGLTTDPVAVDALEQQLRDEIETVGNELKAAGLLKPNGVRDTKAAQALVLEVYPEPELTKIGKKPKLDRDTLEQLNNPLLLKYAEYSSLKKRLSTDVPLLRRGLIQARFGFLETGRTNSKPNVQNLPRKGGIRECYVPREGCVYAASDFGGFELCTVSQVCLSNGWRSKLAEFLNEGKDAHLEVARRIVGCSYEEAVARKAAKDPEIDDARQSAKVANFGFAGGLGPERFVAHARKGYGVIVTLEKARELKRAWLESWPEMQLYFDWIGDQCSDAVPVVKQLFSGRVRANVTFTEACNSYFQGLAADAAKAAGFLISRECYTDPDSPLFGARICNFIHDEFILEVRDDDRAAAAAERLAVLMVKGAKPWLPDLRVTAEPYLMRWWSKKAGPVYVDGRLVPWEKQ